MVAVGEWARRASTRRCLVRPLRRLSLAAATVAATAAIGAAGAGACVVGSGMGTCTEAALDACLPGGMAFDGTVTFDCGGAATIVFTATKTISSDTSIDGDGLITLSGNNAVRLFVVNVGVTLSLDDLTVTQGRVTSTVAQGGAISSRGTLNLTGCVFSDNHVVASGSMASNWAHGGAIFNDGDAVLNAVDCTFTGNSATATGGANTLAIGGAVVQNSATATISGSTFTGNTTNGTGTATVLSAGGAIYQNGKTLTVVNATLAGNSASGTIARGGAVYMISNTANFTNSTLAQAANGSGASLYAADFTVVTLTNSILSGAPDNCAGPGGYADGGHNIDDGSSCGFLAGANCSDAMGTSFCATDPEIDPAGLASNGGPTQTVALCTGAGAPAGCTLASPAINAGDQAVCAAAPVSGVDQRGYSRPGGANPNCCIGAFEAGAAPPVEATATPTSTATATATATGTATDTATATAPATATGTATDTATPTATATGTATATPTPQPDGAACDDASQCLSAFCVDGVCCNTACDGPLEQCRPAGVCTSTAAPAPTLDGWPLLIGMGLLGAVGALALRRRRASL